ncbi:MAG: T9SS type A sorting domain-containing protein, partial [Ignavibacteriota bacterium]
SYGSDRITQNTYDAANHLIDPWVGPSNPSTTTSWWVSQKPYVDPQINGVKTHKAVPLVGTCPADEKSNEQDIFLPGSRIYFVAYFHDQTNSSSASYRILLPSGAVYSSWTGTSDVPYYGSSYWYWYFDNVSGPFGDWKFETTYNGVTTSHIFKLASSAAPEIADQSRSELGDPRYLRNGSLEFDYSVGQPAEVEFTITNALGENLPPIHRNAQEIQNTLSFSATSLPAGAYFLTMRSEGKMLRRKFIVIR